MYRRQTKYTPLWTTTAVAVNREEQILSRFQSTRAVTGEFGLIRYAYDMDFFEIYASWQGKSVYADQTSIMCGSRPMVHEASCDFFDGVRMYVRDTPSRHPDGSFRPVYQNRELDEDHFVLTQSVRGTFVLKSLSAKGTKVNGEVIAQGQEVVLRPFDVIEDRVMYRAAV